MGQGQSGMPGQQHPGQPGQNKDQEQVSFSMLSQPCAVLLIGKVRSLMC